MNLTQIKQLATVDGWVDFSGQITSVGDIKPRVKSNLSKTPGQQYNVQKLKIQDDTDNIGVWAYADKQFLPSQSVTVRGMLKEFNQTRYIDFAEVKIAAQQQQQAPQQAQQGPSHQPESPKGPTGYDKTQEQILRQCAGKCASWLVAAGVIELLSRFAEAERWKYYFETGNDPTSLPNPAAEITDQNAYEEARAAQEAEIKDDIPFEG